MNKREYMERLLELCTDKQKDLFGRMYPEGVSVLQLSTATRQIETTIKGLNCVKEEFAEYRKGSDNKIALKEQQLQVVEKEKADLARELSDTLALVKRLETPESVAAANTEERLQFLNALEAAGVDNWDGYSYAQEILAEMNDSA